MSHVSRTINVVFQLLPTYVGGSRRHGRDMTDENQKHEVDPAAVAPLDSQDPWSCPDFRQFREEMVQFMNQRLQDSLDRCERGWKSGSLPAVMDAIRYCERYGVPPPSWLVQAVTTVVMQQLRTPIPGAIGWVNTAEKALRNDLIHFQRWQAVVDLRREDESLSWDQAYAAASKELEGSPAAASTDTIEASYKKIQKSHRKGSGSASGLPYLPNRLEPG